MIRVVRPTQIPARLAKQRAANLPRALNAHATHGAPSTALSGTLKNYDGGRDALYLAQHKKCAFCDQRQSLKGNAVEHFRPKAEATRSLPGASPKVVGPGYWWLTWTWHNQLFVCTGCNSGQKQTWFPLRSGAAALAGPPPGYAQTSLLPAHEATASEDCLLLDPSVDNPLEYLDWCPVDPQLPKKLWQWTVVPRKLPSTQGYRDQARSEATIAVLGLERLAADHLTPHLQDNVRWRAEEVCRLVAAGDHAAARTQWASLLDDVTHPGAVLAGATWSALHHLVEPSVRQAAGLAMGTGP